MVAYHLEKTVAWFNSFVDSFRTPVLPDQRNYDLKIEHTHRVCVIMERLAASLSLNPEEMSLAAIIALCHDVGRFPQFQHFGTFNDASSVNHAALAVTTLKNEGVLEGLDANSQDLILQTIALHNVFELPGNLDPVARRFAMLIRDADKLDIWRVLIDYCSSAPQERASAVVWELPDSGRCSGQAIAAVIAKRMINRRLLATADDFKLLQISWVYDLNFTESFKMLAELGYIDTLAALLPSQPGCAEAVAVVRRFITNKQAHLSVA